MRTIHSNGAHNKTFRYHLFTLKVVHCKQYALAVRLQKHVRPGDVAAICLPNIPDFAITLLGSLEAGLVLTTINPIYTAGELFNVL